MSASPPFVLAIDAGTTGITALAFDLDLRPLERCYLEFPQHFPAPGEVEHDAGEILAAVDQVTGELLSRLGRAPVAVGITNQRETVFALDAGTGKALRRGIVWQDRRTAPRCRELREAGYRDLVRRRTGLVLDPYFSSTKAEWMLRNDRDVAACAERGRLRFATVDALLVHHLTGGQVLRTEPTNASRTMLFDIDDGGWSSELLNLFGLSTEMLPDVVPSAGVFGEAALAGGRFRAPITGALGDQQAALFGQGCWEAGSAKNTYGTGCFMLMNTGGQRVTSGAGLLTTLAANSKGERCYALEGSAFAGGTVVQWLRDQLGVLSDAAESEAIARTVPDTGGVVLVPAFAGLGAPHWDPDARAAIFGMTRGTSSAHIVRAALDSIAFQCADLLESLRSDSGMPLDELLVDGGAVANDFLMQRQADLGRVRVRRSDDVEATARGAAAIAAIGAGLLADPGAASAFSAPSDVFEPGIDEAERSTEFDRWNDAVRRVRSGG